MAIEDDPILAAAAAPLPEEEPIRVRIRELAAQINAANAMWHEAGRAVLAAGGALDEDSAFMSVNELLEDLLPEYHGLSLQLSRASMMRVSMASAARHDRALEERVFRGPRGELKRDLRAEIARRMAGTG
jgi:hypothetical protein